MGKCTDVWTVCWDIHTQRVRIRRLVYIFAARISAVKLYVGHIIVTFYVPRHGCILRDNTRKYHGNDVAKTLWISGSLKAYN